MEMCGTLMGGARVSSPSKGKNLCDEWVLFMLDLLTK